MKPIYFPYTSLPGNIAEALGFFFTQVIVYQPSALQIPTEMARMAETGKIDIRVPVAESSDHIQQAVEAYHTWARQHAGTEMAYLKTHQGTIPFYDEASVHQIRTDLRKSQQERTPPEDPDADANHKLMQARVFLQLAQEFDLQNRAIRNSLDSQIDMERAMLQNLKGAEEDEGLQLGASATRSAEPPTLYMVAERIAAWGTLVRHDPEVAGVFVTDNQSVLETMLDKQPTAVEIGQWHCPTTSHQTDLQEWRSLFTTYLTHLVSKAWPIDMPEDLAMHTDSLGTGQATLDVYLVPDVNPYAFWGQHASVPLQGISAGVSDDNLRNMVIALVR